MQYAIKPIKVLHKTFQVSNYFAYINDEVCHDSKRH